MKQQVINEIVRKMSMVLNNNQIAILENTLLQTLQNVKIEKECTDLVTYDTLRNNQILLQQFIRSLELRGLSEKTINQYVYATKKILETLNKPAISINSSDINLYLSEWQRYKKVEKTTVNNTIRYINAFFNWLEFEEIIQINPMKKVKSTKPNKIIKQPFSAIQVEEMKCGALYERDKALIEVLLSTGARISEIASINVGDIINGSCIVFGKGGKERKIYFSDCALLHIKNYIQNRKGNSEALFTSLKAPYERMTPRGLASELKRLGNKTNISKVHPHRFRRTMATNALNRGMPLQELKVLMGHEKIDTTMIYCTPDEDLVRVNHKKYVM